MDEPQLAGLERKVAALLGLATKWLTLAGEKEADVLEVLFRSGLTNAEVGAIVGKTANAIAIVRSRRTKLTK